MNEGGSSARSDLLGGAGWIAFGLAIVGFALRMDRFESMGASLYTMPGFVPGLFGTVLVALGAALAWRGWRRLPHGRDAAPSAPLFNRRVAVSLALALVYAAGLVGRTPFWLGTLLFVAAFTWVFTPPESGAVRRVIVAGATGVLTTVVVVLVFEQVFLVRLP